MNHSNGFDLEKYLSTGVEKIVKQLVKAAAFHPQESIFMAKYARASKKASALRRAAFRPILLMVRRAWALTVSSIHISCSGQ